MRLRAAVFASGRGSNFKALVDHSSGRHEGDRAGDGTSRRSLWEVVLLVSDRVDAPVLGRARELGIETTVVPVRETSGTGMGPELMSRLRMAEVDLILLAGYLRLVPDQVVEAYRDRILNIHPALLPGFGGKGMYGLHVHRAVLEAGVRITGPTVHLVDEEYDRGRILAQWPVPVLSGDTPEVLAERVTEVEHRLFPAAADALAEALVANREPRALPDAEPSSQPHFRLDARSRAFNPFDSSDP